MPIDEPLVRLHEVENEGVQAFRLGRKLKTHALWYGFAFCPYALGSVLHANWVQGCAKAFDALTRS